MSSSQDFSDSRKSGRSPEKSNFAQTCNRLSQYLKERGSLRDLGLEIAVKVLEPKGRPETRNLFPNMEKPGEISANHGLMDLFPQHAGVGLPSTMETEPGTAPMTIFYGGQVFVFDNFPADKAGELMILAGGECCPKPSGFLSTPGAENIKSGDSGSQSTPANPPPAANGIPTQEHLQGQPQPQSQPQATVSDLYMPRKASLHRFLEKRKNRVTTAAPYQVGGGASTSSPKHLEEQLALKL